MDSQSAKTTNVKGIRGYDAGKKDYEILTETSEAMVYAAMIHVLTRRLVRHTQASDP
jgi:hypothetical protein